MNRFLDPSFWFDARPWAFQATAYKITIAVFLVSIILGIICLFFQKKYSSDKIILKVWVKLTHLTFSFGLVGLILTFFKKQKAPFLGMRFWFLAWAIICLVWFIYILKYLFIEIPKLREEKRKKEELRKYIP